MKKALSKLQIVLAVIVFSSFIWMIFGFISRWLEIHIKPFTVLWISFMLLLGVSIAINYLNKK